MCESDMDFVHAVLKTLQVVAGHLLDIPDLDEARRGPVWKMRERRRLAVAEIGENEIEIFVRRIGLQGHLAGEPCFLGRLLDALAATVKFPAVIDAADRLILDPAEMQRRAAMRAAIGDDLRHPRLRAVDREVLAHDAQRPGAAHRQVAAAAHRMPELAHEKAARRSRPRGRDIDVDARFAGALTRRCLLSDYHERAPLEPCLRDYSIVPPGRGLWAPCRETNVVNKQTVRVSERGRRHDRDFCQPLVDRVRLRLRLLVGAGAILIFTFGVFLKPVTEDLGVTRGELSGALGVSTWFVAVSCPVIGWLIDRFGTRHVMIPGILLFALAVACFGLMQARPLLLFYVKFCGVWFLRGVQTPIPYAAVITHWFDSHRGIALGLATAGVGLGVAIIPQLAALLIGHFGWRWAYAGLGIAVVVLAWLPVLLFVREPPWVPASGSADAASAAALPGIDAAAALTTRNFWLLSVAFFLGVLAINGTIVHIVALLTDRGVPLQTATGALSVAGIAIIVGRIICGWCLDRFWGPYVAVCFFVLPMLGIALLGSGWGFPVPLVGAALCGAGIGAEIDLMAFFISRYFGLKAYGRIYGLMFMLFNIGTGMGPALSGRAFDRFHSYSQIFTVYEVALALTCVLLVGLGKYAYPPVKHAPQPA